MSEWLYTKESTIRRDEVQALWPQSRYLNHTLNSSRAQLHQIIDQRSRRIQIQNHTKRETTIAQDLRIQRMWGTPQTQSHKLNKLSIMLPVVKKDKHPCCRRIRSKIRYRKMGSPHVARVGGCRQSGTQFQRAESGASQRC
jgi:hypothetical protein